MLIGFSVAIYAQETVTVTGTVTDTNGEPMIGVNITVKDMPGMVLFCDILIAEFYDIRVKRSKSRSCLHDKTFELGTY